MSSPAPAPPRSALLACWTTAWLDGEAALPELVQRVTAHDEGHLVSGLARDDLGLGQAVARLRAAGVVRVRLVLPAPGDPVGLPGPGPFTAAALAASEGVVAVRLDGTGTGLVPSLASHGTELDGTVTTVTWATYDVTVPPVDPGPFLHDAEHDLRVAVVDAVRELTALDVAQWDPAVAEALRDLRRDARRGIDEDELPGSWPPRARDLLVRCRQLAAVVALASSTSGGAVAAHEVAARDRALRELGRTVRRARVAAYNAHGQS